MILLLKGQSLEIVTADAADIAVNVAWRNNGVALADNIAVTTATTTEIVAAPSESGAKIEVVSLYIRNTDSADNCTVYIQITDGTSDFIVSSSVDLAAGEALAYDGSVWTYYDATGAVVGSGGSGVTTFLALTDVDPSTYAGQTGKTVTVNAGETGLEFTTPAGGGDMLAATYDPTAVGADVFDVDNHVDGTTNKVFTATEKTKLAGIETAADVTDATNVAAAGAYMIAANDADDIDTTSSTNKFTTAGDISKLAGIEALADVTDATNVAAAGAYMIAANDADDIDTTSSTNKFTTAGDISKLAAIEANADVTDAVNVGSSIHGASAKATIVDADKFAAIDTEASNVLKTWTWAVIKAAVATYYDSLVATMTNKTLTSPAIAGSTITGVNDAGGATSFEVPNGAGGTTVGSAGMVTVDTTSGTFNFHNGTGERVLTPIMSKAITVESPTSSEDVSMFFTETAITITKMVAVLVGSATPSVTWTARHSTDRSAAGNQVVTGGTVTTSTTTGSVVTSFNDATVPANSFVWLETTAQSGTVGQINLTIFYRQDA